MGPAAFKAPSVCNGRHLTRVERWWMVMLVPLVVGAVGGVISALGKIERQDVRLGHLEAFANTVDQSLDRLVRDMGEVKVLLGRLEERLRPR